MCSVTVVPNEIELGKTQRTAQQGEAARERLNVLNSGGPKIIS